MHAYHFTNCRLILPAGVFEGELLTEGGVIKAISPGAPLSAPNAVKIDGRGMYLSPGFIDIHTHGAGGHDFMDQSLESVYAACRTHMEHGTTTVIPTTITGSRQELLDFVDFFNQVDLEPKDGPHILGLHLEGPYFAYEQRGAQDPRYLRNPQPEEYEAVLERTDRIRRWSFAVELEGSQAFLQALRRRGVVSSVAHSDATYQQVFDAYLNGVTALTHFYSGMSTVRRINAYRVAGVLEAGYLLDDLYTEVIADGCHLPADLLRLIYKVKGADKICLVTDSMRGAGMPDGEYILGGRKNGTLCISEDGVAKLPDRSCFAGSIATTDRLVRTMWRLSGAPLHEVVRMATLSPATLMGIDRSRGSLTPGKDADLLLFDADVNVQMVMVAGSIRMQK